MAAAAAEQPCPEKQVPLLSSGEREAWLDVTKQLDGVAAELRVGQMVHAPQFNLLSAMSALEVMDPKMDAGMATDAVTVDTALGTPLMPRQPSAGQVVHLMDQVLVAEMRWLAGHSLAQTVFTCLYLHNDAAHIECARPPHHQHPSPGSQRGPAPDPAPRARRDYRFSAMAKGTLKCCAIVRNMVVQADFYEEEVFVPQTFGFGMCELTPEPEILAELLRVEQRLTARIKWLKMSEEEREAAAESAEAARLARLEKIRATAEEAAAEAGGEDLPRRRADDLEDPGDGSTEALLCAEGEDEIALAEALRARVTYRRGYLNGLFQLHSKGAKAATFAHKSFKFAQTQLTALAKHVGLGTAAQSKSEDPSIGFNADCNRRLLGPAPPRAMEEMSIEQGIAAAESLFGDMCGKTTRIFRLACFLADWDSK